MKTINHGREGGKEGDTRDQAQERATIYNLPPPTEQGQTMPVEPMKPTNDRAHEWLGRTSGGSRTEKK